MAILDGEIFLVYEWSSEIEVYSSMELGLIRLMTVEKVRDPIDLGSSSRNTSLYIMDQNKVCKSVEVKRVDPTGKLLCKWEIGNDHCHLSVTEESNVCVTFYQKRQITEYSPRGILIRKVKLSDAFFPLHAVKLTNDHYLISQGGDNGLQRVCLVDANGKVEKSFGGETGSTDGLMNMPSYLVVDGNGFVMVIDGVNYRVLLLDPGLKFVREFLSKDKHDLRCLHAILLDEPNRRLFLADNTYFAQNPLQKEGRILIFNF